MSRFIFIKNILKKSIFLLCLILLLTIIIIPFKFFFMTNEKIKEGTDNIYPTKVGIVFGAAVLPSRKPSDILRDRLDGAVLLYQLGKIKKVIVSGDNRYSRYNEPQVMYEYLVSKNIPAEDIVRDYAGLRTYDTCIRAKTLWNVNKAILITQKYHLYRSIYTCEKVGIESIGYSTTNKVYLNQNIFYFREIIALYKTIFDLYIVSPQYIGGDFEENLSD